MVVSPPHRLSIPVTFRVIGGRLGRPMTREEKFQDESYKRILAQRAIQNSIYEERIRLGMRGKQPEVDRSDLEVGQQIEVFVKAKKKDESGWRSPCTVVALDNEGNLDYKWQGQILKAPTHLTRPPAPDLGIFNLSSSGHDLLQMDEIKLLMSFAERLQNNTAQVHGTLVMNGEERLTAAAEKDQMEIMKLASFHMA